MAKIVECLDFGCPHNTDNKCELENVRMVVRENELYCEDANVPTNAGAVYIE
jgi:hypothetical protein